MSYAPAKLLELDAYLDDRGVPTVGIVGDENHRYGYHLGKDRLSPGDYSATLARDKAGLTNAAAGFDVGNHGGLVALTAYLVAEARAGRAPDVREIIGPASNGRAYRWARENGWRAELRAVGDSHEWHCHVSYYRDSEYRDKIALYRAYYEGDDMGAFDEVVGVESWAHNEEGVDLYAGWRDGGNGATGRQIVRNTNAHVRRLWKITAPEILAGQAAILAAVNGESADEIQARVRAELERAAEIERTERQAENAAVIQALRDEVPALAESLAGLTGEEIGAALGEWIAARLGTAA